MTEPHEDGGVTGDAPGETKTGSNKGQFQKGDDPRRGVGKKGRSGRPPNEFRESLRRAIDRPKTWKAVLAILANPDHPQFSALYTKMVAQGCGNPTQAIEHSGAVGGHGVLAVPVMPNSEEWTEIASKQQAALTQKAPLVS